MGLYKPLISGHKISNSENIKEFNVFVKELLTSDNHCCLQAVTLIQIIKNPFSVHDTLTSSQ